MSNLDSFDSFYQSSSPYYGATPSPHLIARAQLLASAVPGLALDLGCGEGRDGAYLAELGLTVIGLDRSPVGLRTAATRGVTPLIASTVAIPIRDGSVGVINATTVLDHLSRDERSVAEREIRRVALPGCFLAIEVFTVKDPGYLARSGDTPTSETSIFVTTYFELGELRERFSDIDIRYYHEGTEWDYDHGPPHIHGVARMVGILRNR